MCLNCRLTKGIAGWQAAAILPIVDHGAQVRSSRRVHVACITLVIQFENPCDCLMIPLLSYTELSGSFLLVKAIVIHNGSQTFILRAATCAVST